MLQQRKHLKWIVLLVMLFTLHASAQNSWHPVEGTLATVWSAQVTPENVHPEYPRPQLVRKEWKNLNGLWDYAIAPLMSSYPGKWQGKILVPFPVESSLSGVKDSLSPDEKLWYHTAFTIPSSWHGQRVLLHFGAVDWEAQVWVNGKKTGHHQGGYDAFTFDITDALQGTGPQQLTVAVWDPSDAGFQPAGKQTLNPHSIWYTATSGIWQTVWLEPVPEAAVKSLKMTPDIDQRLLQLKVAVSSDIPGLTIKATAYSKGVKVAEASGKPNGLLTLKINNMQLWSPDDPFLYDLKVTLLKNGQPTDEVKSYFGMRKISLGKDNDGYMRLLLNNKPLFQFGPLDQGFWPDGLYTAPTDEALKYDIEVTKKLGFNMIRKHVKVEPQRWYYWCDKLGMLVWQDMPSGDAHIKPGAPDTHRVAQSDYDYRQELKQLIATHYDHPSIVTWVPFNEGWGQFRTADITQLIRQLDSSRLVDAVTGWQDRGVGDMHDMHSYPGPAMYPPENNRASVLGEFGGQALVVKDHLWLTDLSKAPRHYKTSVSPQALHEKYDQLIDSLQTLKSKGLAAAVYTQTTDVETEVNGLMTYDRKVIKFDTAHMKAINSKAIKGN